MIRVVDFETTGTEPPAVVIEVGVCDVIDDAATVPRSWLHGADRIPPETRAIHHISPADIVGKERFYAQPFVEQAKADGTIALAAHRAEFEGQWLGKVLGGLPLVCTYKAALRLWPDAPSHSNQCLRYFLEGIGETKPDAALCQPAHRAGPDAYATAILLAAELARASLADLIAWTGEPALLPRIPIGKQRGAKWPDVEEGFLRWMLRTADIAPDLKWNAQREIDRRYAGPKK